MIDCLDSINFNEVQKVIKILLQNGCCSTTNNTNFETPFFMLLKKNINFEYKKETLKSFTDNAYINFSFFKSQQEILAKLTLQTEIVATGKTKSDSDFLFQYLSTWNEMEFVEFFKKCDTNSDEIKRNMDDFLEEAVLKNFCSAVSILIEAGVDVNITRPFQNSSMLPVFFACILGNHKVLKVLVKCTTMKFQCEKLEANLLHNILFYEKVDKFDRLNCFNVIIGDHRCSLELMNQKDSLGRTALFLACYNGDDEIALELLQNGAYIGHKSVIGIIDVNVLETFLNISIKCYGKLNHKSSEIFFDHKFLMPPKQCNSEIESLFLMARNPRLQKLISHPALSSFILLKWEKMKFFVYLSVFLHLSFVLFVVFLMLGIRTNERKLVDEFETDYFVCRVGLSIYVFFKVIELFRSMTNFFFKISNWIDVSFLFLSSIVTSNRYSHLTGRVFVFLVFITAGHIILSISKLPIFSLSTHIAILRKVCKTFLKTIGLYMMIISSFVLSFYILYHDTANFSNPFIAILSTLRMLLSDFSVVQIEENKVFEGIIFFMFMICISIARFSFLNDLAVSDTRKIIKIAGYLDLNQRISTIHAVENFLLFFKVSFFNIFPRALKIVLTPYNNKITTFENFKTIKNLCKEKKSNKTWKSESLMFWRNDQMILDEKIVKKTLNILKKNKKIQKN